MIPFVAIYSFWANGLAGLIPSTLAYLAGCLGIYRLARHWLLPLPGAVVLFFFATNPNLLYLQTTAMTEPLFVCEMIWTSVWLVEWRSAVDETNDVEKHSRRSKRLLFLIGWVMAFLAWSSIGIVLLRRGKLRSRAFWLASAIVVAAPVIWCVYNAVVFGDWLDFMRGPYSAKAIELRTASPGSGPPHPGWHDPWMSLLFFVKAAEMDAGAAARGNLLLIVSLVGTVWAGLIARRRAFNWSLLLWLPVPFYAYSVAYSSVPIFLPVWWPHSFYNTRYGMELLPAFALGTGFAAHLVFTAVREFKPRWAKYAAAAVFALLFLNVVEMLHENPLVYVESTKNVESRCYYEKEIPPVLRALLASRPGAPVLMETSVYPNLVAFSGIPLRQTINGSDMEFYQAALAAPATKAAIVVAFDGSEIARAVQAHPEGLTVVRRFASPGRDAGTIYISDTFRSRPNPQSSTTVPAR
jgi:hypothetical protein